MAVASKERIFSAGQLARELGVNIRTIYRWEESGVIPTAQRVTRGRVSARVYPASEVERIRKSVQGRLDFGRAYDQIPLNRGRPDQPAPHFKPVYHIYLYRFNQPALGWQPQGNRGYDSADTAISWASIFQIGCRHGQYAVFDSTGQQVWPQPH